MSFSFTLIAFTLVAWSGLIEPSPDFKTEILPIFQRHCFECHGNGNREGELNLETLAGVRIGGHSGSPLLSEELKESELYLRVTSTTAGYRMPKQGDPLTPSELSKLAVWIKTTSPIAEPQDLTAQANANGGGAINEKVFTAIKTSQNESVQKPTISSWLSVLTPGQRYQAIGVSIAILLLLLYLVVRAVQTRNKKRQENAKRKQSLSRSPLGLAARVLFISVLCAALIGFGYYYFLAARLSQEVASLSSTVARLQPKSTIIRPIGPQNLPLPPYPMHPKRLGGRYYRGNDERDPALFNGGFYRTATIDLRLTDAVGRSKQWEDEVADVLFVEITVDRAPQATRELFTDRVREAVSLQHYNLTQKIEGDKFQFDDVEAEQRWRAKIALPKIADWEDGQTAGMIYMMYGVDHAVKSATGAASPRPHFGIRYEVDIQQGKISSTSTLWMGSMYTLGGRVMVPRENQVLLDRWFDWRPIPTIEGEGSSDPKLLGLPEHLENKN